MAKDLYHERVKNALKKDGWTVTHDPYRMTVDAIGYEIDLGAERLLGAEREGFKIAVEIKSFVGPSTISEFHRAVGQFNDYFVALESVEPDRELYLAIPENMYLTFFQKPIVQKSINRIGVRLVIYEPDEEKIVRWIK